jgi:hypothetical protein
MVVMNFSATYLRSSQVDLTTVSFALLRCLSVPTLASFGSEIWLCWADPSSLEPDWTQCLR